MAREERAGPSRRLKRAVELIHNERTKLTANWLDRAGTAAVTIGVVAPDRGCGVRLWQSAVLDRTTLRSAWLLFKRLQP